MRLILASTSPYRQQLLRRLRLPFEALAPHFDEKVDAAISAAGLVRHNTLGKLRSISHSYPDACVIASDQLAECDGKVLGKPGSEEAAIRQLTEMSGKTVRFLTGVAVAMHGGEQYELVSYAVHMRELSIDEIEYYVRTERPLDCAGSFKSEGLGVALFRAMEGDDPTALIGLPLIHLSRMLQPLRPQFTASRS